MKKRLNKVERTLDALAVVLKDQSPELIAKVHDVINDKRDGYAFDFRAAVDNYRSYVIGEKGGKAMRIAKATGSILAQNIRADKVIRTSQSGVFKFRLGFFYRHGMTDEKYAAASRPGAWR